jgi:hypothetical protein
MYTTNILEKQQQQQQQKELKECHPRFVYQNYNRLTLNLPTTTIVA